MAVPQSVTDSYDAELTAGGRKFMPRLRDNITKGMKYLALLDSKGRIEEIDGGYQVEVPLMYALNNTADVMGGYGIVNTTPQDGMTAALYDWSQMAVSITISKKEKIRNKGPKKFDLLQAKIKQAETSLKYLYSRCLVQGYIAASGASGSIGRIPGKIDPTQYGPLPLGALIDITPTRSRTDIGGINPNTYGWWANQATSSTATTFAGFKKELYTLYNNCSRGNEGGSPDIFLGGQTAFEQYHNSLQAQEQYVDMKVVNLLNGAENLKVKGAVFIWDELVPDTETNAIPDGDGAGTAVGTMTVDTVFAINSEYVHIKVARDANFSMSPFVQSDNQVGVSTAIIDWMGVHAVSNRRKCGQLYGIAKTIAS